MTVEIDGVDLVAAAEAAAMIGGLVAMLVIGLLVYLVIRPPRHVREVRQRPVELQESEAEQLLALMGRMESRLEVLERALADESHSAGHAEDKEILESAEGGREKRRMK